jgi:tight adherence protein B
MGLSLLVFVVVSCTVAGAYVAVAELRGVIAKRRMEKRLREVGSTGDESDGTVLRQEQTGALPAMERLIDKTGAGTRLAALIEQSGVRMSVSAFVVASLCLAALAGIVVARFVQLPVAMPVAAAAGASLPYLFLLQRRSARIRRFEEQFPEALDLLSRALRAGHAFQTALGMVADELPDPVGPEFKKTFDQQNFGLPLKDALGELAGRIPIIDVRFFVTAVSIQRDTGGNLAEILDNLAAVVRERFKILRQVRVHTAHGRMTGYVLLALPAALGMALAFISPNHMNTLFNEALGRTMLIGAGVMQTIGYVWIRQVIKIEV